MKKVVQTLSGIRAGDIARIHVRLKSGSKDARIFIYSRHNGVGDFSPHVDEGLINVLANDRPQILRPFSVRLNYMVRKKAVFNLSATEPMEIQVIEEVDFNEEIGSKARIKIYGQASQKVRRIFGNIRRSVRGYWNATFGNRK